MTFLLDKEDVALNKAWKMIVKETLAKSINKKFENSDICEFSINICMEYEKNMDVISSVYKMLSIKPHTVVGPLCTQANAAKDV